MLLIISSQEDLAADYLILRLLENGSRYVRFNSERHETLESSFELSDSRVCRQMRCGSTVVDLSEITCVWYRRSIAPTPPSDLCPDQRRFAYGELAHFWTGLFLDCAPRWVNPIDKVQIAEHKLYQLRVARSVGFSIPQSIVSRKNRELVAFIHKVGDVICKPVYHGLFVHDTARFSVYTRRVTAAEFEDDGVQPCHVFLQREIKRAADVRVTIIGQACFSVRIRAESADYVDWRPPGLGLSYSIERLPERIEAQSREMMKRMGLLYGAFDFILTPDGEYIFLEVNPTGEWAWLEDRLELPMRDAFCRLFFESHT
jgi:hypothetical protein